MTDRSERVLPARTAAERAYERRQQRAAGAAALLTHALGLSIFLVSYNDLLGTAEMRDTIPPTTVVFQLESGPGGGGGGGGEEAPEPAAPAEVQGEDTGSFAETEDVLVVEETPAEPEPKPEIDAPIEARAPDEVDRVGVLEGGEETSTQRGEGAGVGAGGGAGGGAGTGEGEGLGEGTERGFGGGAYRIGSGVTPPALLRQVPPEYTPDALQRQIAGDVVLEIIVLADGTVGPVRVIQGLDPGLDRNAVAAARQWRFRPGTVDGAPVAVIAEIVMEFRLI